MSTAIQSLFTGRAVRMPGDELAPVLSGIVKTSREGRVMLSKNGFHGDEQGDKVFHGGPEKAVHHYPSEHYARWRAAFPDSPVPLQPGAFGENISTFGMTESNVCIGDVYQAGRVLLQVSQGRQPCWKLNRHLGHDGAALAVQRSGAVGWYYRVLQEGLVGRCDKLELVWRPNPAWTMERLHKALFAEDAHASGLAGEWAQAAAIDELTAGWRATFARRVESGQIEDWSRRLQEQ